MILFYFFIIYIVAVYNFGLGRLGVGGLLLHFFHAGLHFAHLGLNSTTGAKNGDEYPGNELKKDVKEEE